MSHKDECLPSRGTRGVTIGITPTEAYTDRSKDVTALSFTVDGQSISLSDHNAPLTAFEFSQLTPDAVIWDITLAETVGTSPERLALDSTAGYTFYYNNLQSAA